MLTFFAADGQIQGPTGAPVTQIGDGQIQAPTGSPVSQISDGTSSNATKVENFTNPKIRPDPSPNWLASHSDLGRTSAGPYRCASDSD